MNNDEVKQELLKMFKIETLNALGSPHYITLEEFNRLNERLPYLSPIELRTELTDLLISIRGQ